MRALGAYTRIGWGTGERRRAGVEVMQPQVENDDWPEYVVYVTNSGPNREVFA